MCDKANRNLGCHKVSWDYQHFETSFLTFISEIDLRELLEPQEINDTGNLQDQLNVKKEKYRDNTSKLEKYANLFFGDSNIPQVDF
jgi:hypothetical protein